jgi:hypothetical protein
MEGADAVLPQLRVLLVKQTQVRERNELSTEEIAVATEAAGAWRGVVR